MARSNGKRVLVGGDLGCTTARPAWLSHTRRAVIWAAARTCSTARSPTPDDARELALLLAQPSAVFAALWLVWPLSTATGPCSRSTGPVCTTNQRDRPRERTTGGGPPTGSIAQRVRHAPDRTANPRHCLIAAHRFRTPVALHSHCLSTR
jgi:hypothetical protein